MYNGDSDSGLLWYFDQVSRLWPRARWVFVERDRQESSQALSQAFPELYDASVLTSTLNQVQGAIEHLKRSALCVRFQDLDDPEVAAGVWNCCLPGLVFDRRRWELFNGLKVEPHHDKYLERGTLMPAIQNQEMMVGQC